MQILAFFCYLDYILTKCKKKALVFKERANMQNKKIFF